MGPRSTATCILLVLGFLASGVSRAADTVSRQATWQETFRLAWKQAMEREAGATGPVEAVTVGAWYRIGPFKSDPKKRFETAFPPLAGVDVTKPCGGQPWKPAATYEDGTVHTLTAPGQAATFLFRTLTADSARKLTAYLGSDDGLGVWLNGERIHANKANRGASPNQDKVALPLKAGRNELLLMIYNNQGGHGFYFSLNPSPGNPRESRRKTIWGKVAELFSDPVSQQQMAWESGDGIWSGDWTPGNLSEIAGRYLRAMRDTPQHAKAKTLAANPDTPAELAAVRRLYYLSKRRAETQALRETVEAEAVPLRRAVTAFAETYHGNYDAEGFLRRIDGLLARIEAQAAAYTEVAADGPDSLAPLMAEWQALRREALLSTPALDFDDVLFIKRRGNEGLTANWQGNDRLHGRKLDNEIAAFSLRDPAAPDRTIYRPDAPIFVGDVDLDFDGGKMLFSTNGTVCEVRTDGSGFRKVVTAVDSYDPCYLPDGERLLFVSNSGYHAVPCVSGNDYVGNIHIANLDGSGIRRLCFDQDNNWHPAVLPNGRILYTRWEYTDSAHYFSRVLMHMNPDGTNQVEFYGSNSYWPNSLFYARPIPGSSTRFAGIVTGHHGVARMGELVVFDAALGRHEASGAVQRIPGYGKKVEAVTLDRLVDRSWPKFLHPYPLSESQFLVACRLTPSSQWGIYLADLYDNLIPVKEIPGTHCLEPLPLRKTVRPPVVPDMVQPDRKDATVFIQDIYEGKGLRGVPRGTVKSLRVYEYVYAYRHTGGHNVIGYEGPWDVRRVLGTVDVQPDGSTSFRIPANTPLALQPLDADGKALTLMRSWFVGMPGEAVSCVGCHAEQNMVPPVRMPTAARTDPKDLEPWYGPTRGFSFRRELQPVLDRYCVGCHDGSKQGRPVFKDDGEKVRFATAQNSYSKPYLALARYVRRNGPEGDYHPLTPLEFHADTSELVQILEKGHYNVRMDAEAWDRLITWIDVNVPYYGTWREAASKLEKTDYIAARERNRLAYAYRDVNLEAVPSDYTPGTVAFEPPDPLPPRGTPAPPAVDGWPFGAETARSMQGDGSEQTLDLGNGVRIALRRIPAGRFPMGSVNGLPDEVPLAVASIERPFRLGETEVTNLQYAQFDAEHDSGVYDRRWKDQVNRGYFVNQPDKPAIRVSWERAMAFCRWLSAKTGRRVTLPTEAQWEWACRAGTATPTWFGRSGTDFGSYANLADRQTRLLVVTGVNPKPVKNPHDLASYLPAIWDVDDGTLHLAAPGTYAPNPWGLADMHGNVAEWTRSIYRPYPYVDNDGRNDTGVSGARRVARGGSWHDRPIRARSAIRQAYPQWQPVFNVGFRVAVED